MTTVRIDQHSIVVEHLELADPSLAAFLAQTPEQDRAGVAERALRIGLLAICNANVSVSVDVVRSEFEQLLTRLDTNNAKAADALAQTLRQTFGDKDGQLPRTLEQFLGDEGKLRRLTTELFDPNQRGSAIAQLHDLLGRYFDGDGSRLAQLLDPTRAGSPLHQFRNELTEEFRRISERFEALEAAGTARAQERARGTAKGTDFEDALEDRLSILARGLGDFVERTGTDAGDAIRSKRGDFVITIDPTRTRGAELRIVVEAKDRQMPLARMTRELADARENRSAAVALAVFTPLTAPASVSPLAMIGPDVFATYDPETDDAVALEAAYRAARILALIGLRDAPVGLDTDAVARSLDDLAHQVDMVRSLKTKLTYIGSNAREVSDALELLRAGVLRSVKEIESQLDVVHAADAEELTA